MNKDNTLTGVTYSVLKQLMTQPGRVHIYIHKLKGYFVPFVMHSGTEQVGHGPIVTDGCAVASADQDDLIEALKESLGQDISIIFPGMEPTIAPDDIPQNTSRPMLH